MRHALKTAAEYQDQAAGSAALAMKHRFAIIDGVPTEFMGHPRTLESMALVVSINERDGRAFYAAARQAMAEDKESGQ